MKQSCTYFPERSDFLFYTEMIGDKYENDEIRGLKVSLNSNSFSTPIYIETNSQDSSFQQYYESAIESHNLYTFAGSEIKDEWGETKTTYSNIQIGNLEQVMVKSGMSVQEYQIEYFYRADDRRPDMEEGKWTTKEEKNVLLTYIIHLGDNNWVSIKDTCQLAFRRDDEEWTEEDYELNLPDGVMSSIEAILDAVYIEAIE